MRRATRRHGYSIKLPNLRAGTHMIAVYAIDTLTGALVPVGSDQVVVNQAATGAVEVFNATTISGWAMDPNAGTSPIQVR